MNTFKKLFITLTAVLVISLGFSQAAYASELTNQENTENKVVASEIENNEVATDIENIEKQSDISDEGNTSDNSETENIEELEGLVDSENLEGEFDPDTYEIFIDEQGQAYYIEKEPVEPEILDSDEIVPEEEPEIEPVKEEKIKKPTYTKEELRLLSCLVYSEAGNQSYKGMLAVANVVLNRVKSDIYYHVNTIKEVIYDKHWNAVQFSVTIKSKKTGTSVLDKALKAYDTGKFTGSNPAAEKKAMNKAIKAAKAALNGENNIGDYLCFRMNNEGAKKIKVKYTDNEVLGNHIFYRTK